MKTGAFVMTTPTWSHHAPPDRLREQQIKVIYLTPGSPWENGHIESFHDKFRDERLNRELLGSLAEAKIIIESWRMEQSTQEASESN
jgi:putative transposase